MKRDDDEARAGAGAEDSLDRAIVAGLRRRFAPPEGVGARVARTLREPPRAPRRTPGARRVDPASRWLALAAALALFFLPRAARGPAAPGGEPPDVSPVGPPAAAAGLAVAPLAAEDPRCVRQERTVERETPDLARIYHDTVAVSGDVPGPGCGSLPVGDSLPESLRRRFGAVLSRGPRDAAAFAGPIPTREWRSATVLAAFPDDGGMPSVLVADDESRLTCCLALSEPEDPALNAFFWSVDDVFLVEITPRPEPLFLDRIALP